MDLRTTAEFAENIAAGFMQFRDPLPEHTAEITGLVSDLYAISATLTSLDELAVSRPYRHNLPAVKPDLELVRSSLHYTLENIFEVFGHLDARGTVSRGSYKRIWLDLCSFFEEESSYSLSRRLRKYKMFLKELEDLMQDKSPDVPFMADLRSSITTLLAEQDGRFAAQLGALTLEGANWSGSNSVEPAAPVESRGPGRRRSYERARPALRSPQFPLSDSTAPAPLSPSASSQDVPPYVPDVPGSPTTSNSTATRSNISSAILNDHWARKVFSDDNSVTRIPYSGQRPFEPESNLSVYFYVREDDHRARIVCKVRHTSRASEYFCLPLNLLEVERVGACLRLCRRRRSGLELVPWLNLRFYTIEKMVIFFCTFLALRSQDFHKPVQDIRDYELDDEEEMFGGYLFMPTARVYSLILEGRDPHALRVYRDIGSGAVRLQASVYEGERKRAPVWTAFITHHISSPAWLRRVGPKVIHVSELRRVVFCAEYTPPRTPRGEYILKFTSRSDAEDFVETIDELAGIS
ncbi:hypothetical protein T310_4667 [Rasamsonia emersonii CBS 393.64]|uniref:Uncharacterized protein n=1 Tax=Rasamsonia emersonii (strain ATCC 16479 / CBS 393.64 / IMI 116815) TaxID=1408163 RepID=A0A0F4YTX5_RASE3|nr:hypothetical protein T310_4667 [Rasamsonia emersonii CBS 393.64]KKA21291.1 hypothetical protein T310_4667 [Rasamsonia emersonii CBS 393.64]